MVTVSWYRAPSLDEREPDGGRMSTQLPRMNLDRNPRVTKLVTLMSGQSS